jgi:hypothetical protein
MTSATVLAMSAGSSSACAKSRSAAIVACARKSAKRRGRSVESPPIPTFPQGGKGFNTTEGESRWVGVLYFRNRNSRPIFTRFTPLYSMMSAVA